MGVRSRMLAFALVAGTTVLPTHHAWAQAGDPEALVHEGVVLRRDGHDDLALERFRRAYEIGHRINAVGFMGFAEQALGQWVAAERDVREALSHGDDPWVRRNHELLERALAVIQQHVGQLDVRGEPAGAEVLVNGNRAGTLPLAEPVRVAAGTIPLEVRADGFITVTRNVSVSAGQLSRETVDLARGDTRPAAAASRVDETRSRSSSGPSSPGGATVVPIVLGTAGVVLLGAGIGFNLWRENVAADYNQNCPPGPPDTPECATRRSNAGLATGLAVGSYVIGGAAVAASVILLVTSRGAARREARDSCGPGPGDLGVSCTVMF
jgi:hypothetical protein